MYVATFYSYKGGVGRTMALANVAYLLASAGKRVLTVDFDLEAPGLSSYGPFRCAGNHPGIVEYVGSFLENDAAPDVADYIMECRAGDYPIWLMPAGRHTQAGYAVQYSSISWQDLYREHDGFLLFEDLRQQWEQHDGQGFDYVLIDSRTGHTDIGGICTRQLPDAVVVQFLPTAQNLEGLRPIVDGIRAETAPVRRNRVKLLFCPSNLPEGDDQELILQRAMASARAALRYTTPAAEIYHYGALDLLEQPIYVQTNPNTRLSGEYRALHDAIIGDNLRDREGAIIALNRMRVELQSALTGVDKMPDANFMQKVQTDAALISATFQQDVEIAWGLAVLAGLMTRPEDELEALNTIVEVSKTDRGRALLRRARARASLDDTAGAVDDLERLLTSEAATAYEIGPATELLRRLGVERWRAVLERAAVNPEMAAVARALIIQTLLTDRDQATRLVPVARASVTLGESERDNPTTPLALALMADGQFEAAMAAIAPERMTLFAKSSMADLFNYGICEWAVTGFPPLDLFIQVLAIRSKVSTQRDANGLQCFALCEYVLGRQHEALKDLKEAQSTAQRMSSVFSCWRYLAVDAKGMLEDLDEMFDTFTRGVELRAPTRDGLKGANAM